MMGPWKLCRIVWRLFLSILSAWLLLALLWALLPFPSGGQDINNGADYATKTLLGGKILLRVYWKSAQVPDGSRQGFALYYQLNTTSRTLAVSGLEKPIDIFRHASAEDSGHTEEVSATARAGDTDGANLPYFPEADALLLFWQIHQEYATVPLRLVWSAQETEDVQKFDILLNDGGHGEDALLSLSMKGDHISTLRASFSPEPRSSSPSSTYPLRAAIIRALAPFSIILATVFGPLPAIFGFLVSWIFKGICLGLVVSGIAAVYMCYSGKRPHELVDMLGDELQKVRDSETMRKWRESDSAERGSVGISGEQKKASTETGDNIV
ncbi:hypothetical protein J3E68DRAFT_54686 [Trichoderma sp. SZMC 28012]